MNSLQLISKLKVKSEDLHSNIKQILSLGTSFSMLEKELLKKQCTDLFELILKLKTEEEENSHPSILAAPKQEEAAEPTHEKSIQNEPIKAIPSISVTPDFQEILKSSPPDLSLDEALTKIVEVEPDLSIPKIEEQNIQEPEKAELFTAIEPIPTPPQAQPVKTEPILELNINIEKAIENKRIQKTVMPEITEKPTVPLNETFKEREATFNDKNLKESLGPIAEKSLELPIDNIKNAINLNKKIAFVNELFNKNVFEYAKSIDRLNQASDLNEALRIFTELKHQNAWSNQNELVIDLERIVKRRFNS
jgi:hypothetical protein